VYIVFVKTLNYVNSQIINAGDIMPNITLSIPQEIYEKMKKHKEIR